MAKRYKEVPTYTEIQSKIEEAIDPTIKLMAKALYYTGARIGELIQIEKRHVWEEDNFVKVKLLTEKNRYNTERVVPIPKKLEPEGATLYTNLVMGKEDNALLFATPPGILTSSWMRVLRRDFNLEYDVAPHYFRHCRLTHMVTRFNYDSHQLVKYAGWTDERPAKHYVHLRTEDLEAKML